MLGASFDTEDENHAFAEKLDLPFVLLCDIDRTMGVKYHAARDKDAGFARRIAYLIDPEGNIAKAYREINPKTHAEQVLQDLGVS